MAGTGTAIIRGRVGSADTRKPIRWASVVLSAPELGQTRAALTDEQGRYEFNALPPGTYTLRASKDSFIGLTYGQTRPSQPSRPLSLGDTQVLEHVDFALPRGGVIVGRLYDELGDPAVNLTVTAMQARYDLGRRRLIPAGASSTTNDLGEFRIYGLQPGQYYVSATMRFPGGAVETPGSGFAPSYFPGTTNFAEARRVTVGLGQTATNVDIPLTPVKTAKITGMAVDVEGRPLASAGLNLVQHGPEYDKGVSFTQVRPDGSFALSGVPPGTYSIDVRSMNLMSTPIIALADSGTAIEPIMVDGEDVAGLRISTKRMSGAHGHIVFDPTTASQDTTALRIGTIPVDVNQIQWFAGSAKINADLTFDLPVPSGLMMFAAYSLPAGWALKAVHVDGRDVTDSGIEFKPGEKMDGIEVELSNRVPKIQGSVHDSQNRPVEDYAVLLFSQQQERWTDRRNRYFATARPDQTGRFTVNTLPAGDYFAIAVEYLDQNEAGDPELLERLQMEAMRVSLADGETKTLDLKLTTP